MGIFGEQIPREQENLQEIIQQVFPNGWPQMDKEIQEVRQLLNSKYSVDQIANTYLLASSIYYISKDRSRDRIITSILKSKENVINREEALLLFEYLKKKFNSLGNSNSFGSGQTGFGSESKMFLVAKGGLLFIKEYKEPPEQGKYEAMIFNSLIILQKYHAKYPVVYEDFQDKYFTLLLQQANSFGINLSPYELGDFINLRMAFYKNELDSLYNEEEQFMPARLYSAFYTMPLKNVITPYTDFFEVMKFFPALNAMIKWVIENTEQI